MRSGRSQAKKIRFHISSLAEEEAGVFRFFIFLAFSRFPHLIEASQNVFSGGFFLADSRHFSESRRSFIL